VLAAKDQIRRLIEQPEAADEAASAALLEQLQAALAAPEADAAAPNAMTAWRLRFRLPPDAMTIGTNPHA
jgi:two-component system chemotaxis sensor kinase CheA